MYPSARLGKRLSIQRAMFQLNDPVTRFIPEWRDLKVRERAEDGSERLVEPRRPMTVRDLMTHMSGLGFAGRPTLQELFSSGRLEAGLGSPGRGYGPNATLDTMVQRYTGYPLEFHPGTHWLYSISTDVCGRLVEIISGQRFDEYLREALGRKMIDLMTSNHLPGGADLQSVALPGEYGEVEFAGMGFGLTVAIAMAPTVTQVIGSPGEYMWGGAASTIFWVDPAEELIVVFMTQFMPSGTFNFRGQLKTLVYPAIAD